MNPPSIPISIYIHMPWCVQKCPYCDFNSHKATPILPEQQYIKQLCTEWDLRKPALQGRSIHSIFIGGGTPSLISPNLINHLLNHISSSCKFSENIEITMEANPGTVDSKHFIALPKTGINRISLGVQSFNEQHLKMLGRIHNSKQAKKAFDLARDAGFNNINIDLMHGLPGQNIQQALSDLEQGIQLQPEHLSWYQLTIEPNTHFAKYPPHLPQDETLAEIQHQGEKYLSRNKYNKYEVSAFCANNKICEHNKNYWSFGDYIGIGAGAHSKISCNDGKIYRCWNHKHPKRYLQLKLNSNQQQENHFPGACSSSFDIKLLQENDLIIEFMLCCMRLNKPISKSLFECNTNLSWNTPKLQQRLNLAAQQDFISLEKNTISVTSHGKRYLNELLEIFI